MNFPDYRHHSSTGSVVTLIFYVSNGQLFLRLLPFVFYFLEDWYDKFSGLRPPAPANSKWQSNFPTTLADLVVSNWPVLATTGTVPPRYYSKTATLTGHWASKASLLAHFEGYDEIVAGISGAFELVEKKLVSPCPSLRLLLLAYSCRTHAGFLTPTPSCTRFHHPRCCRFLVPTRPFTPDCVSPETTDRRCPDELSSHRSPSPSVGGGRSLAGTTETSRISPSGRARSYCKVVLHPRSLDVSRLRPRAPTIRSYWGGEYFGSMEARS